jgi:hypothetical protein
VATEKQIAANRANALCSTGPKTAAGKKRSSQNALRHGLSLLQSAEITQSAGELAHAFADVENAGEGASSVYFDFACAYLAIRRIRQVQTKLMAHDHALYDAKILKQLTMTERYERRALTKRRRATEILRSFEIVWIGAARQKGTSLR